jgi:signal transduction histidine kinase
MARRSDSTKYAPSERAGKKALAQQTDILANQSYLIEILNAVSTLVVILNQERQIVFANKAFLDLLGKSDLQDITGGRVGEVLGCIHSNKSEGGCGTTDFCSMCGAVNAMLSAQEGNVDVQECRITREDGNKAYDLRVMASPLSVKGHEFSVFSIQDIGDEKRKDVLERIFMHDLQNTAGGLQGLSRLLSTASEEDLGRYSTMVNKLADRLVDEIDSHKLLMQAEKQELKIRLNPINTLDLLQAVRESYVNHEVAREIDIVIDPHAEELPMESDESLLMRVLGNMTKNALEASSPGESVTLSCKNREGLIRLSVHNPGVIPRDTRLQIFQRSFSTKGSGRGLGTYSIKLLSEQYLRGKVGFSTSEENGTLFFADYPQSM